MLDFSPQIKIYIQRHNELSAQLCESSVLEDRKKLIIVNQEFVKVNSIVELYESYKKTEKALKEVKIYSDSETDSELLALATEEVRQLEKLLNEQFSKLSKLLIPPDPLSNKNVIMEIRAGTGGEEAALFAADLYRMYVRYAELKSWSVELIDANETGIGGMREVIFEITGRDVYGRLRYESGTHRVQRVPVTEGNGRIQTSAATIAVLPEAEETDIELKKSDLRVDTYRASGAGGQHINKTDSAVRITHLPSGVVVAIQDSRSQIKNREKAMTILRSRLFEMEHKRRELERSESRRTQIGSGDRSERIRTYNFPQNRVTDHRINLTLHRLDTVLQGEIDEILDPLNLAMTQAQL